MGRTENGDHSQSNDRKGGCDFTGGGGKKAMKVSAPIVISGAVSPIALDKAMMMPVIVPPIE